MSTNSRRTAAFIVAAWLKTRENPSTLLPADETRSFVQDVVFTTFRRLRTLRAVLGKYIKQWPKGEMEALLYIGAAQLLYMPDVPDFAAVNETVDAAKFCENRNVSRLVNAVLRNVIRDRAKILANLETASPDVRESIPRAMYRRWLARYGEDGATKLAQITNEPAETFIARKDGSFSVLERGKKVIEVEGYKEGDFIVQDPATRLAIELIDPHPDESILDMCAAPGGKTIQMFWRGANIVACEINPSRRRRLAANLERVGASDIIIAPEIPSSDRHFDKILVDAPCSNTGVWRRRPDARWNWSEEKLASLVKLQASLLDLAASRLNPGGTIVYSTCSNEPEENALQIEAFLQRHPSFILSKSLEETPLDTNHDGAFAAALHS